MNGKRPRWQVLMVLLVMAVAPASAVAGPYLGDWGYCWKPAPDCPHGAYPPLHYWMPAVYYLRACCHPSNVDSYPPGTTPPVPPTFDIGPSPCRTRPSMPMRPYAEPDAYYGRPIAP
jgi:hypothetical protein